VANQETQLLDGILASRRTMLMGGSALAGLALMAMGGPQAFAQSASMDTAILNFALNLEYLEATFYILAASGALPTFPTGAGGAGKGGTVVTKNSNAYATCKVPFSIPSVNAYALEVALEERNHVTTLQAALGASAVAQPNLDLYNSFIALGNAIGVANFDPFSSDYAFLLGSYIFEDVGVSAYHGAAPLIYDKVNVLPPAVEIHAVEAYHASLIRTTMFALDQAATPLGPAGTLQTLTQKISNVRATFDGTAKTGTPVDIGVMVRPVALESGSASYPEVTILDGDSNSLGWARTTTQVLSIVYASSTTPPTKGGFFPAGLNGSIA
jgi:hypothetical protein